MYIMSLAMSYYWILEYTMFTLLLLLCLICGLTQITSRRLITDSQFTTQRLAESQLTIHKLLDSQLATYILSSLQITTGNLQACILESLLILILVSFELLFFCELMWSKGKLIFENDLFHDWQNLNSCHFTSIFSPQLFTFTLFGVYGMSNF